VNLSEDTLQDRPYLDTWNHPTERSTKNVAVCNGKVHVAWFNSPTWSHTGVLYYRRSLDGGLNWEPKVALVGPRDFWRELWIDCKGDTVIIMYEVYSDDNGVDIRYKVSEDGGATWSGEYAPITSYITYNQEAPTFDIVGSTIHMAWADNRPYLLLPLYNIYYKRGVALGSSWTSDNRRDLSDSPILIVDPANSSRLHLWFMTYNTSEKRAKYQRSTDGGNTWSSTVDMSGYDAGGSTPYDRPIGSMAVYNNVIYYMWVDERTGNKEVMYKRSLDGGSTWLGPSNLSGTPTKSWNPYVEAAPTGEARLYWMDSLDGDWEVVCKITTDWGDSWGALERLTNNSAHDGAVSVDYYDDHWYIVWSSDVSGDYEVYFTVDPCPVAQDDELGLRESERERRPGFTLRGNVLILNEAGDYAIYSRDGRLYDEGHASGGETVRLRRGVWFLRYGGRLHRIIVR